MLLKPVAMQRIAVIGSRDERQRVATILYDIGVVQIEPVSKDALPYLRTELDSANVREVSEELLRIRALRTALPHVNVTEKKGYGAPIQLLNASRKVKIDSEVARLKQDQGKLSTWLDELANRIDLVTKLNFINEDLSIFDLESASSFFGTVSKDDYPEFQKNLASITDLMTYSQGKDPVSIVVVVPTQELEKFGSIIQRANLRLQRIPKLKGKPDEVLSKLNKEKETALVESKVVEQKLKEISETNYSNLASLEEQLAIETRKLEAINNFGFTDNTFALEGWIPEQKIPSLTSVLGKHARSATLFRLESDEKPPTLLENPKRLRYFESFIRFYTLPQSGEFDPTIIFAITFPIFFGLMLGDVGYGLAIIGISYWILNRLRQNPRKKTIIPRQLRSFARNIFKPVQFQKLAMAMMPGAVIGVIFGFGFNEYFGFHLNQYLFSYLNTNLHIGLPSSGAFLDPSSTRGLKDLLLFTGYVGLFEVSFGLVLGMINSYWAGEKKHIFGKLGWFTVAWGISLIGLTVLHHGSVSPTTNPIAGVYIALLLVGLALIGYGEGPQTLIELPSIISHILSYTRLLGILLASVELAAVIDTIFLSDVSSGIAFAVMGVIILIFGQIFNLVLALFEPGIQGARLIYVEFFSKFYHGNGKMFLPFKGSRIYTVNEIEMMDSEKLAENSLASA
ncbi:MAG: V-type ATP synthase subunit I [Nitrososphaerota archaeon]|nr:V-type ATP synthase subunit I [Nitrososphaerota archaeon]